MTEQKEITLPVDKMSCSSLLQLLRNPLIWKLKYVLGVYDSKIGISGMVGRAGHEALQVYYGGNKDIPVPADRDEARSIAIEYGLNYLDKYDDSYISYGKTGTREAMLKKYIQAMNFYFAEEPDYHEVLFSEERMEGELKTTDGDFLPLPAVGKLDLVHQRKDGGIEIIDTKFVTSFTDWETEDYTKIVQSQFYWHLLRAATNLNADRILFREIKTSENSGPNAGKPQIQDYAIPFAHDAYRVIFYNLYKDAISFISNPNAIYLPNLSDTFDGEQAGMLYAQGLISADMSDVEVMHKVKDVAMVSKKFVGSRLDKIENAYLLPEERIRVVLAEFGIPVEPQETIVGDNVTRYQFKVSRGVRMSVFDKHKADIARAIEAKGSLRILAPIPGTALVGIEVENEIRKSTKLTDKYYRPTSLDLPLGMEVDGTVQYLDLQKAPHVLIAGTTGSGKSVLLHNLITAISKQMLPSHLQLTLIDPKRVELAAFAELPHLHGESIIYEYDDALQALQRLTHEMEVRYEILKKAKKRDIIEYNAKRRPENRLPYRVIVFDEFADFMLRKKDKDAITSVEVQVVRLAAMGRAAGIHIILATQRPSVDVITGLIKANFPTRIALTTASMVDSKVILETPGAEKLGGKGDMIFRSPGNKGDVRLQGFSN